jgi:hypothetical protein
MSLTSPLIDQAFAQACAVCSPKSGSMSGIAILRKPNASFDSELLWNFLVIGLGSHAALSASEGDEGRTRMKEFHDDLEMEKA